MAILEVKNIEKSFGTTHVLKDISFELERGQALAIIGSSGSGKTTLLRCLNFLETPDKGTITVGGEVLFDAAEPAARREAEIRKKRLHFGLVFQSFNLFPQYTALKNVTLAKELLAREDPAFKADPKRILADIEAEGRALLARMRETASLPVLTKPADVRLLPEPAQRLFALEAWATDLYTLAYPNLTAAHGGAEWREGPVIL